MDITLDAAAQTLSPQAQGVLKQAALSWLQQTTSIPDQSVAPDTIRLLNTTTNAQHTIYEIEIEVAGNVEHVNVLLDDAGRVQVQAAE